MDAAAALNNRIRLEGGANMLAAAQAAGVRRYLRQSVAFYAIPGPGLADEGTPLAIDLSPAVAAGAREITELEHRLLRNPNVEGIVLRYGFFYGPGTWFNPDGDVARQVRQNSFQSSGMAKASGHGYTLRTRRWPLLQQQSAAILGFIWLRMINLYRCANGSVRSLNG